MGGIGVAFDPIGWEHLEVTTIDSGLSAVSAWNEEHPEEAVCRGDLLVEVNGCTEPSDMINECKRTPQLRMTFQRSRQYVVDVLDEPNSGLDRLGEGMPDVTGAGLSRCTFRMCCAYSEQAHRPPHNRKIPKRGLTRRAFAAAQLCLCADEENVAPSERSRGAAAVLSSSKGQSFGSDCAGGLVFADDGKTDDSKASTTRSTGSGTGDVGEELACRALDSHLMSLDHHITPRGLLVRCGLDSDDEGSCFADEQDPSPPSGVFSLGT